MFILNIFSLFTLTTYITSRSLELKVTTGDIFQPMVCNIAQLTFIGYNLAAKNVTSFGALRSALRDYKRLQGIPWLNIHFNLTLSRNGSTVNYGKFQWNDVFPRRHENRSKWKFGLLWKHNCASWLQRYRSIQTKAFAPATHANETPWLKLYLCKGRFTRYDFVAYDKLTTGLRHELFRVNQTYNSLNGPKSCRRPVVSLWYRPFATVGHMTNNF